MSYVLSTPSLESTETAGQPGQGSPAIRGKSQQQSPHIAWIHILDDDSLLNIFYLYRPPIFDGDESDDVRAFGGSKWDRERWWHKLAQVCQRWRTLLLGSASYLGLCLVCTWDTPVADMLAHSPPLPLIIDYDDEHCYITAEVEEMITLALERRDRVRRVRLRMPVSIMTKLIMTIDEEYPVLEYLILVTSAEHVTLVSVLPKTLEAPNLRHLLLLGVVVVPPIESRLLTTAIGMVTLCLHIQTPSAYFQPDILVQCLSFMPRLDTLLITTYSLSPTMWGGNSCIPHSRHASLPNLRYFGYQGSSAYMEAVVRRITAPRLEKLDIQLSDELALSVPHLLQFMNTTKNLRFDSATFGISGNRVSVWLYLHGKAEVYALSMDLLYHHLQVSSVGRMFNSLGQKLSTVEHLSLEHEGSSEEHDGLEVDPTEWRKLLRSFRYVKTLRVDDRFVQEVSRCLELDDGEYPLGLLPELQELAYSGSDVTGGAFTSFVDARQDAGRPVILTPLSRGSNLGVSESSDVMTESSEAT